MSDTDIPTRLISAYLQTEYVVRCDGLEFSLRVNHYSRLLHDLHISYGARSSAFITACNPYSKIHTREYNDSAQRRLEADLQSCGFNVNACTARDPQQDWPDEAGFLITGITETDAENLGRKYDQNAILYCDETAIPRLVPLR